MDLLRALNRFIEVNHFKMEGFHIVKVLVRRYDWLIKVDLRFFTGYCLHPSLGLGTVKR